MKKSAHKEKVSNCTSGTKWSAYKMDEPQEPARVGWAHSRMLCQLQSKTPPHHQQKINVLFLYMICVSIAIFEWCKKKVSKIEFLSIDGLADNIHLHNMVERDTAKYYDYIEKIPYGFINVLGGMFG